MNGYVLVINDSGVRHIITTSDYKAAEFAKWYYEECHFHRFESDVFIFVSGTMDHVQRIAKQFEMDWRERDEKR